MWTGLDEVWAAVGTIKPKTKVQGKLWHFLLCPGLHCKYSAVACGGAQLSNQPPPAARRDRADPPICNSHILMRPFNKKGRITIQPRGRSLGCWSRDKENKRIQYFLSECECVCERVCVSPWTRQTCVPAPPWAVRMWRYELRKLCTRMRLDWFSVSWISGLSADRLERDDQGKK